VCNSSTVHQGTLHTLHCTSAAHHCCSVLGPANKPDYSCSLAIWQGTLCTVTYIAGQRRCSINHCHSLQWLTEASLHPKIIFQSTQTAEGDVRAAARTVCGSCASSFGNTIAGSTAQNVQKRLMSIFDSDQQDQLAHVYTMTMFRNHCLSLPHGSHIVVNHACPPNCGGGCGVD
jgi:hypothetical protein